MAVDPRAQSENAGPLAPEEAHREDWELVQRVLAGSPESREIFAQRMTCVAPLLVARNRRFSDPLSREELLDLAQDVQLRVWRNLPRYRGGARIETWVYGFCRFGMMKFIEKRRNRMEREADWRAHKRRTEEGDVAADGAESSSTLAFDALIEHLSEREAEVTRLRHGSHLEFEEIARVLGVSASTAKTHYYRALKKLRPLIERGAGVQHP